MKFLQVFEVKYIGHPFWCIYVYAGLSLEPLIGAVASGNTVVLKPSELAPACSSFLANTISTYLDNKAVKVIEGGSAIGELLLQQRWDKILFTGTILINCTLAS